MPVTTAIPPEEIFGPVAPVVAFDTGDEVVELPNDTGHHLVSCGTRRTRTAAAIELNRPIGSDPAARFGGG